MADRFMQKLIFLYVIGGCIGPAVLSVNAGFMHVSIGRMLQPIMFVMCLYKIMSHPKAYCLQMPLKPNTYSVCFFILWLLYALLSCLWTLDRYSWLRAYYFLFGGVVVILAFSLYLDSVKSIKHLLAVLMWMIFAHTLIGYYEMLSGNYFFLSDLSRLGVYQAYKIPVSSMNNVNDYAMLIMIGIYSTLAVHMTSKKRIMKAVSMIFMIMMFIMCVLTRSRGILFGLILSMVIGSLLYRQIRRKLMLLTTLSLILFVIALITLPSLMENITDFCTEVFTFDVHKENSSDFVRLNLILNGLLFLMKNLLMGTGLGGIEYYMQNYAVLDTLGIMNIHNWWFEILVASGIFIFCGYCFFYVRLLNHMWRCSKHSNERDVSNLGMVMVGFLTAFPIASISSSSIMGADIIWTYFAIIIAFEGIATKYGGMSDTT